jgi:hypothetical protein
MQENVLVQSGRRTNGHRSRPWPATALVHHGAGIAAESAASERGTDIVHEWGLQSFPASDPPANW